MNIMIKTIVVLTLTVMGIGILLGIPTEYEGPLLVAIFDGHDINLTDAAGIITMLLPWGYLLFEWIRERINKRKEKTPEQKSPA